MNKADMVSVVTHNLFTNVPIELTVSVIKTKCIACTKGNLTAVPLSAKAAPREFTTGELGAMY